MLEPFGVSDVEERTYRVLLRLRRGALHEVSKAMTEVSHPELRAAISALERKGLVNRAPGKPIRYIPVPAGTALEALILRREEETARLRALAEQMVKELRDASRLADPMDFVELILGGEAVEQQVNRLQLTARNKVDALSTPPYASPGYVNEEERQALSRGVRYRMLYSREAIEIPSQFEAIQSDIGLGEEARVVETVPLKLVLVDRRVALVPVSSAARRIEGAIVVHPSPLLDALVSLFEMLWAKAFPVVATSKQTQREQTKGPLSPEDRDVLSLMLSGMTDEAMARQLSVSPRTLRRRVSRLLEVLDAGNRFQAGYVAAKQGYL